MLTCGFGARGFGALLGPDRRHSRSESFNLTSNFQVNADTRDPSIRLDQLLENGGRNRIAAYSTVPCDIETHEVAL